MKKRWEAYFAAVSAAAAAGVVSVFIMSGLFLAVHTCALVIAAGWWTLYFRRLVYFREGDSVVVKSGVVFRKRRVIPLSSVLWTTRFISPLYKGAAVSVLHTGGGIILLFADFSTNC